MKFIHLFLLCLVFVSCNMQHKTEQNANTVAAKMITLADIDSKYVESRRIDVWFPSNYSDSDKDGYAVLYMHDGQNIFKPELSYTGIDWGVDEALSALNASGKARKTIVVGIWNTARRNDEYLPEDPSENFSQTLKDFATKHNVEIISNNYLKFIVEELKPQIDAKFNTRTDAANTFVMGSSMGGLISWYALAKYPEVFGGAACLSTHWPVISHIGGVDNNNAPDALIEYFQKHFPKASKHKIYFDYGTTSLDADYEPYQLRVDEIMKELGYQQTNDWVSRKFEGAGHNEAAWRERVHIPLEFLLKE